MSQCAICNTATNQPMCAKCMRAYLADLNELRSLLPRLESVARREERIGAREQGHANPAFAPTPVDLSAMDVLTEASETLEDICYNCGIYYTGTWRRSLSKLIPRRKQLMGEPNVTADRERVRRLAQKVRFRLTPPSERIIIGPCLNSACGTILLTTREQTEVTCLNCGSMWKVEAVRKRRREELAHETITITPAEAAAWVKANTGIYVTRKNINNWTQRAQITHTSLGEGLHEYNKADLLRLAETMNPKHW